MSDGLVRVSRAEDLIFVTLTMQNGVIMRVSAGLNLGEARELAAEIGYLCDEIRADYA